MGRAVIDAAREAGIRITLLDTCYLHGGIGREAEGAQLRFSDGSADAWAERVAELEADAGRPNRRGDPQRPRGRPGGGGPGRGLRRRAILAAPCPRLRAAGRERGLRLRLRDDPDRRCSRTPAPSSERFTAVHATHLAESDFGLLGDARMRSLPLPDDRARPRRRRRAGAPPRRGGRTALARHRLPRPDRPLRGSAGGRARRAARERRCAGSHSAAELLRAATAGGHGGIGWPEAGRIAPGALADLVTVGLDGVRLAGTSARSRLESVVFAAGAADVRDVIVGGEFVVRDGAHLGLDVAAELGEAIAMLPCMSSLAIDNIGLLVTNDPALGEGPLGIVRDAALVFEGDRVAAVERPGRRRRPALRRRRPLRDPGLRRQPHAPRLRRRPRRGVRGADGRKALRGERHQGHHRGHPRRQRRRAPRARRAAAGRGAAGRDHAPRDQVRLRARRRQRAAALRDRRAS